MKYIIYGVTYVLSHVSSRISSLRGRAGDERGQDLIEYVLLASLIASGLIAAAAVWGLDDALTDLAAGIGRCIDFEDDTTCETV